MQKQDPEYWEKISQAREALEMQLDSNDDVCYVDIGCPQNDDETNEIALRVHLCGNDDNSGLPQDFEGIPVTLA